MSVHAQHHWQHRFAADRQRLEQRRAHALEQAQEAVALWRQRWPSITRIWCFGSVLTSGFREHSDLDLLIEGLPPGGLLEAVALAERTGPLSVDLKRIEDLPPDLLARLLRHSQEL
jgi:predicted nucleotidyltransferase